MRIESKTYENSMGEVETIRLVVVPATIKSISEQLRMNSNGTEWRLCSVEIQTPDGDFQTKQAQLFERSYEKFPDSFAKGEKVELSIQIDGEGKGFAKIELPALERIDVDAFVSAIKNQADNHLVQREVVA